MARANDKLPQAGGAATPGNCHVHPHALASDRCPTCHAAVCEYCLTAVGDGFLCRGCARRAILRKRLFKAGVVISVLAVIGGVGYLAAGALKAADTKRIAKGQNRGRERDHQRQSKAVAADLCSEQRYKAWVVEHSAGDCDKILARAQFYFDKCGPFPRLRWSTYTCYKRKNQPQRAIAEVTRLIRLWPFDKDFRWWRAEMHARLKAYDLALDDYWQAVLLHPRLRQVPFDLEWTSRQGRQRCRAVFPVLQYVHFHKDSASDPAVSNRLQQAVKACSQTLGTGSVTGPRHAGTAAPPVAVQINNQAAGDFAVDLDTGLTLISATLAKRLGLPRGKPFLAWYGDRLQSGHFVKLPSVAWGGARARQVEALVLDSPPFFHDGVLGRSFLLRFSGRFHADGTTVTLVPRRFARSKKRDHVKASDPPAEPQ